MVKDKGTNKIKSIPIDENQGGFIELVGRFLGKKNVDHTTRYPVPQTPDRSFEPDSIKIEKEQKAVEIVEKDCKIITYFYQGNEMGVSSSISKTIPQSGIHIVNFKTSKDSRTLDVSTNLEAHIGSPGTATAIGRANLDISIKDALKELSEVSEGYDIECMCDYPFGIKCKGTRRIVD